MKVYIRTFGCQMNKLDSETIGNNLIQYGHTLVTDETEADVIIFNTCSVRQSAEERAYANLRLLKTLKDSRPELIIGLVGCMAEKDKTDAVKRIPYLDLVCGPNQEHEIPRMIDEIHKERRTIIKTGEGIRLDTREHMNSLTREPSAYVLAMRGCDNYCSYCVVPYVRGREISRPMDDIVTEVKNLAQNGVKEITLLGQNISSYVVKRPTPNAQPTTALSNLLKSIHDTDGIQRIRFITSHPAYTKEDLFYAMRDLPKVCPYIHMPAQSGSNKILKAMNRKYTREDYLRIIEKARKIIPDIEFGSDFIVGFPGETESDFQETVALIKEVKFINSFIFKYSTRPGTASAKLLDDVPYKVKQERNKILLDIQSQISREKNQSLVGKTMEILVEGKSKTNPNRLQGRTKYNQIVICEATAESRPNRGETAEDLIGKLVNVTITSATDLSLRGKLY